MLLDPRDLKQSYQEKVAAFEKAMLLHALESESGNQSKAAGLLGMTERHFRSRMQILGIVNTERKS